MSHQPNHQSSKVSKTYGIVTVMRDPVRDEEVTSKRYVDNKWVVGDIKHSVRNTDHIGWLICDGRSLSRTEYADLFSVIGTAFGSASGTTFNLPNCRGRVVGTVGTGSGLTARSLGDVVGAETHTMTTNQMPSHSHTGTTDSSGTHTHTSNANGGQGGVGLVTADGSNTERDVDSSQGELNLWTLPQALVIDSSGAHTHTFTTGTTGNGQAFNIMQPTIFMGNAFIFSGISI
jgi:microcystin-dependent protein